MNQHIQHAALLAGVLVIGWGALDLYQAHEQRVERGDEGSPPDTKFCQEWLHYYEKSCTLYPTHCAEGPKKKARCVQGWDK